ncbi:alpha/beta fold hydrolase [Paenibacillus camelliae]|uniref:alpha/beta fold hydrolase n=1 Tax=Paenibacillus camelliae TaxID=512410 RepID=UPI00203E64CA|nr:alpha/beta hydrolase [Paenibacillus camelliae]MCM3633568.1 alpha/beta hydrolase [Paenibacillus camelliae]
MNSSKISIRGTQIYVEDYNSDCNEVLLYLHGGPGASCVDFSYYQAKALSKSLRVIALDQRGVLRSDPIGIDEQFGINDIIQDLEELRIQFNISKWTLLGHSFGGYLAAKYALIYPNSIEKIIFEAPCFDVLKATRSIISMAKNHSIKNRMADLADVCDYYLSENNSANVMWNALGEVFQVLGEDKDLLYLHSITPQRYNEIIESQICSNELWEKNIIHNQKLQDEGGFFEDLLPILPKISHPTLLLAGTYDPVCCGEQQSGYLNNIQNGQIINFERSAHFPRLEQPEKYTTEVLKFILEIET